MTGSNMRSKRLLLTAFVLWASVWYNSCAVSAQEFSTSERNSATTNSRRSDWTEESAQSRGVIDLSYEQCFSNGVCKTVEKLVKELPRPSVSNDSSPWELVSEDESKSGRLRTKRRIFGADNSLRIYSPRRYPFGSAVAISVDGVRTCSGVAINKTLFLTAAHCLLSNSGYIGSDLKVGIAVRDEAVGWRMKWTRVRSSKYHIAWSRKRLQTARRTGRKNKQKYQFDYAVLATVSPLDVRGMTIAVVEKDRRGKEILQAGRTFIHISAYDHKQLPYILRHRFCKIDKASRRRILSKCDTVPKTAGAGVYVRTRNKVTRRIERKVIAIETGDYRKPSGKKVRFSSALRITGRMFAHVCYLVTGKYANFRELKIK